VVIGLAVAVVPALEAQAAGTIQISDDGVTYGAAYPGVLFDGIANFAPGDSQTEVFYLRNTGPDAGFVRIIVYDAAGDPALLSSLSIRASVPAQPGSVVVVSSAAPCWVLNEGIFLAAGATLSVTATLTLDVGAGNPTQKSVANFGVGVSLTDTAIALAPSECEYSGIAIVILPPDPEEKPETGAATGSGVLTNSGSDLPIMLISVTAFIMGVGLFFVVAAWRRRREDDAETFGT
jgi:hypothetical protein